jgi:hypothetical protein
MTPQTMHDKPCRLATEPYGTDRVDPEYPPAPVNTAIPRLVRLADVGQKSDHALTGHYSSSLLDLVRSGGVPSALHEC